MGNAIGAARKKTTSKVMKLDGTVVRPRPPATAGGVLRDYPGYSLLEADEVKRMGAEARPLHSAQLLEPGKLYFLVELPRRGLRRAFSEANRTSAADRLEGLKLARRRSTSDPSRAVAAPAEGGAVRVRVRLPRDRLAEVVGESRDEAEVAERIVALCFDEKADATAPHAGSSPAAKKERRTRFKTTAEELKQCA